MKPILKKTKMRIKTTQLVQKVRKFTEQFGKYKHRNQESLIHENYSELKAPCIHRNVPDIDVTDQDQENYLFQSELEQNILYPCLIFLFFSLTFFLLRSSLNSTPPKSYSLDPLISLILIFIYQLFAYMRHQLQEE